MIKYFCDRCKKETDDLYEFKIGHKVWFRSFPFDYNLCKKCRNEFLRFIDNAEEEKVEKLEKIPFTVRKEVEKNV